MNYKLTEEQRTFLNKIESLYRSGSLPMRWAGTIDCVLSVGHYNEVRRDRLNQVVQHYKEWKRCRF
jgi:hypothetical protein